MLAVGRRHRHCHRELVRVSGPTRLSPTVAVTLTDQSRRPLTLDQRPNVVTDAGAQSRFNEPLQVCHSRHPYCNLRIATESATMSFQALSEYPMPDSFPGSSPNARFLAGSLPVSDTSWKSYLLKSSWSVLLHVARSWSLVVGAYENGRDGRSWRKPSTCPDITWIATPGPGGGGGGGGNKMPDPPRKAEITPPKPRAIEPPKANAGAAEADSASEYPCGYGRRGIAGGGHVTFLMRQLRRGPATGGGGGTGTGVWRRPGHRFWLRRRDWRRHSAAAPIAKATASRHRC